MDREPHRRERVVSRRRRYNISRSGRRKIEQYVKLRAEGKRGAK